MKKYIFIAIGVFLVALLLIAAHFIYPLQKSNEIVTYTAKKGTTVVSESEYNNSFLPDYENYLTLSIADYEVGEDEFANIKTKTRLNKIAFNSISLEYDIEVIIEKIDGESKKRTYSGTKIISLKYESFKWYIAEVISNTGDGSVCYDDALTLSHFEVKILLYKEEKNVGVIGDEHDAIKKARALWESELSIFDGVKFYSHEDFPDIRINYDKQEDCWIIVGHVAPKTIGNETWIYHGIAPISIIKSSGEVIYNGVLD